MVDPASFFKALGVSVLGFMLVGGLVYWIYVAIKKFSPNLKYILKYKFFRHKYNEQDVQYLLDNIDCDPVELEKMLLLEAGYDFDQVKELMYILGEVKKLQGGKNK